MPVAIFVFPRLGDDAYLDREDRNWIVTNVVSRAVTMLNASGGNAHGGKMKKGDVLVRVGFWGEEDRHEEDVAVELRCGNNPERQANREDLKIKLKEDLDREIPPEITASLEIVYQDNDFVMIHS